MAVLDILFIISGSILGGLISEAISWFLIYRKPDYIQLKKTIDGLQSRVDKTEGKTGNKSKDKQMEKVEESLKEANRKMATIKFQSTFFVAIAMISLFTILSNLFDGRVIATLPFEPFGFITGLTHRGLPGTNYRICGFHFIFALSSLAFRPTLQRLLGTNPPRTPSSQTPSFFG